jgi:hypothetical protein
MAVEWTAELEARVLAEMGHMHTAMVGERSRADAWAAMLGVAPGPAFTTFMVRVLSTVLAQEDESSGLNHGIGIAVALRRALQP